MASNTALSRRRFLQAATAAAAAPWLLSNAPAAGAAPRAAGGTLTYAEGGDFNDFNPWGFSAVNVNAYNQVFARLTYKDGKGNVNGDMAESWELASDGMSFTAKLKSGVRWQDGKPHTAQDWVDIFNYTKDETLAKDAGVKKIAGLITAVKDVRAIDDRTVQFSFTSPVPYFPEILDYWYAVRIDDKDDPKFLKKAPVGTGPFKLEQWVPGQFARFSRYDGYHMAGQPGIDEFRFNRLEKAETLIPNLLSGAVQGVMVTTPSDVARLKADSAYALEVNENAGSLFNIIVNVQKPPLDKKEVRQALSYSLNRVDMAETAFFGVSNPTCSPFYSPSSMAYREDLITAHKFDLDRARKLLDSAGVGKLELTANVTPRWPQMKLFMLIWQADLEQIGVKLTVNEVESAKFYDIAADSKLQGFDLQPWLNGRTTRDPAIFLNTQWNYRGGPLNNFKWVNDSFEKMVADAAVELDTSKRRTMYQQINELLVDEMPMINVATDPRIWAFTNNVRGLQVDLSGNLMLGGVTL